MSALIAILALLCAGIAIGWLSYRLRFKALLDELEAHLANEPAGHKAESHDQ